MTKPNQNQTTWLKAHRKQKQYARSLKTSQSLDHDLWAFSTPSRPLCLTSSCRMRRDIRAITVTPASQPRIMFHDPEAHEHLADKPSGLKMPVRVCRLLAKTMQGSRAIRLSTSGDFANASEGLSEIQGVRVVGPKVFKIYFGAQAVHILGDDPVL